MVYNITLLTDVTGVNLVSGYELEHQQSVKEVCIWILVRYVTFSRFEKRISVIRTKSSCEYY